MTVVCAAPGCEKSVPRGGRGRPAIYCSPACRPTGAKKSRIVVELDAPDVDARERPMGRVWQVRMRRGKAVVIIADGLGRLAAVTFAREIEAVLAPDSRRGGAVE